MATSTVTTRQQIQRYLQAFEFKRLFVEILGWDNLREAPIAIACDGQSFVLRPLVEKRGVKVYACDPDVRGAIAGVPTLRKIESELTKYAYEHIIIYADAAKTQQAWQWVKRGQGKAQQRLHRYYKGQSGEALAQKLEHLLVDIAEEERIHTAAMVERTAKAFDVERVTKRFYDRFKLEHAAFLHFIQGITEQTDREWYASLMLNRLMFIYFIQRKGFLDTKTVGTLDGDDNYLSHRLQWVQEQRGEDQFHTFYRYFLLRLFHDGLSKRERTSELEALLGNIPYLNGGLFDVHALERTYPDIAIPDKAFENLFAFFNEFDWHLDNRPLRNDREINPDVLGYIFEKYINQKQMGAYYTKEDITEYISKNTIIPYIFDAAEQKCLVAFNADGPIWSLLRVEPDRYIYDAVKKGAELSLPPEIEAGIHDVARRGEWNRPAPEAYALPTEIWREVVARRTRYAEVKAKLAAGEITSINDLITYNLDIVTFAEDAIAYCEGSDLLRAFYDSIRDVTVLDPTCGSGAFLFAALNILERLYEACLERMQQMIDERDQLDAALPAHKRQPHTRLDYFRNVLSEAAKHPSRKYFIYKSIIIHNLYGVDIMEEATEICKLRLFLKLVSQVHTFNDIEPLPDIDFNIRAGNTLVGFASHSEVERVVSNDLRSSMVSGDTMHRIEQKAQEIERDFENYRSIQTQIDVESSVMAAIKQQTRQHLKELNAELDVYLASEYGIDQNNIPNPKDYEAGFAHWQQTHQPFHWWVEFYGIMENGGFDVIIGNPPYVEYGEKLKAQYRLLEYATLNCGNLHAFVTERTHRLAGKKGRIGLIVPLPAINTTRMETLQKLIKPPIQATGRNLHVAAFDERPSNLFVGVDQRLVVEIFGAVDSDPYLATTGIIRWASITRNWLFQLVHFAKQSDSSRQLTQSILKISDDRLESRMLSLLYSNRVLDRYKSNKKTDELLAYRTAGGRYWKVTLDHPFDSTSLSNKVAYLNGLTGQQAVALMSSSTFWWYYSCHYDMYNLKDYMIFNFRFSDASEQIFAYLQRLGARLVQSLMDNSTVETVHSKTRGAVTSRRYVASKSKPIIDEIDRVLAQHYGFTDEELDFIINYDIKYRMGQNNGSEGEE